ncbi:MAG: TM0996/MTH895 family glutaredoxin-like protein [Candidatus Cloacimonetes bacterium]|nr:TM0996/MTH895 family glutaredoxin-like protein [Candidatus Cloacimonadota bacterium]MBS3768417.1 TM0996/MTH895 family glutaredoxin-like protein [Candidatus Cloacimonadota bacterium]
MIIKILGTGCPKCKKLETSAKKAVQDADVDATVEKVTDVNKIMDYGVMMTPALVIDEEVVSAGRVLSPKKIVELLNK